MKISFKDDYSEGCHPNILQRMTETNLIQTAEGNYGEDRFTANAKKLIHKHLQNPESEIHLVSGGTQANLLVVSAMLRPHEAVIAVNYGHIATHETGAIEATGHKVITVDTKDGKIQVPQIEEVLKEHYFEHMVLPRMVYISNTTELGTLYTKKELVELRAFCDQNNLLLFMDGARLGSALTSSANDITLKDLAQLTDVFYIGGTKNGALLGEAIVINNPLLQPYFRYHAKQKGALLAKGRLLGIQFEVLFTDGLFFEIGLAMNEKAMKLAAGIKEKGYSFWLPPTTNQIFPIFENKIIAELEKDYIFHRWAKINDNQTAIRLVTSWATPEENMVNFLKKI
ncbi:aminotransferase class I/II-fold pyridoxal phosphate-dependent enzyme [Flavobacteriaceae bacterium Ap0902]|nr:aminotransferase class I/II-fold pyridoxal phosphate-dependent enzyme [Flavobacteriaceae bacterium Ap0902]